jgi:hypothetical protein
MNLLIHLQAPQLDLPRYSHWTAVRCGAKDQVGGANVTGQPHKVTCPACLRALRKAGGLATAHYLGRTPAHTACGAPALGAAETLRTAAVTCAACCASELFTAGLAADVASAMQRMAG